MGKLDTIEKVVAANLCLGCGACAHVVPEKIKLALDDAGYLRPQIAPGLTRQEQARAIAVCPGIHVKFEPRGASYNDLWGPLVNARVGWSTDERLRHSASSGGAISALASYLLEAGKVDAILHIGVSPSDPLRNEFRISRTPNEVAANAGSRYAPGAPLEGLKSAIEAHAQIGFIGKPCDIVAIRKIASADRIVNERIKICISFMCAGVPSMTGTHAVLKHLNVENENVVQFRYRGNGWPGHATATTRNGAVRTMTYDESWGRILNKHLQFRCKICVDGTGEFADVTCADAWYGTADGYPDFEERPGRSLLLARTAAGAALISEAEAANFLHTESLSVTDIERMQPYQASRKRMALSRITALRVFGRAIPTYDVALLWKLAKTGGIKSNMRSFAGIVRRLGSESRR